MAYDKEYYQKHKEEYKERARNWYLNNKERHKELQRSLYQKNREKQSLRKRTPEVKRQIKDRALRIKLEILSYYSNSLTPKCVWCGETRLPALTIDHIINIGNELRKNPHLLGTNFYSWLKRKEYPEGYQTLCMNCQFVKREALKCLVH